MNGMGLKKKKQRHAAFLETLETLETAVPIIGFLLIFNFTYGECLSSPLKNVVASGLCQNRLPDTTAFELVSRRQKDVLADLLTYWLDGS